jgi:curved DNA-binding protein CbpA
MPVSELAASLPRFNPAVDYYAVLQVHPDAHVEVIKRAYRTILGVLGAHPDLGGRHDHAVCLNEAYAVLTHPEARRAYDIARRRISLRVNLTQFPYNARPRTGRPRLAHCRWCGAKNRLPTGVELAHVVCGKCRRLLARGW